MNELLYNNDILKGPVAILFMQFSLHFSYFKWDRLQTMPVLIANYLIPAHYLTKTTAS